MIVSVFDWNHPNGHDKAVEVSDTVVRDFVRFIMRTNAWKDNPDAAFDRLLRFRRELVESIRDVVAVEPEVATAPPTEERPRRGRPRKVPTEE